MSGRNLQLRQGRVFLPYCHGHVPYKEGDFYHKDGRNRPYNSYILGLPDYSPPAAYTSAGTQYKAAGKYSLCTPLFYEGLRTEVKYIGFHPDIPF